MSFQVPVVFFGGGSAVADAAAFQSRTDAFFGLPDGVTQHEAGLVPGATGVLAMLTDRLVAQAMQVGDPPVVEYLDFIAANPDFFGVFY